MLKLIPIFVAPWAVVTLFGIGLALNYEQKHNLPKPPKVNTYS